MRNLLFVLLPVLFLLVVAGSKRGYKKSSSLNVQQNTDVIGCGTLQTDIPSGGAIKLIPLLPGHGNHHYPISTVSDSTQQYFDQGLSFYYGYHFREALASFREAARFDKNCAMAYWGQALAMGPYYNTYNYKMSKDVPIAISLLSNSSGNVNEKEKDLVNAMKQRYSADTTNADRHQLDSNYAAAMNLLLTKYPADNDIKALYIDAMMLRHKWDFWTNDGNPKPWTSALVRLCETILKVDNAHPAALHYYIHLTEASKQPRLALQSAETLKDIMPGIGHMVHMATHMYQRNGMFTKAVAVNEDANDANNYVDSLVPALQFGKNNAVHIYAVQSYCAMNAGMYEKAAPIYQRARERLQAQQPSFNKDAYAQFVYMIPVAAMVRLGKWQEILQSPKPPADWKYAAVLDDFAKGMAYVHSGDVKQAKVHFTSLKDNVNDSLLAIRIMPFNKPIQCANIAANLLSGEILFAEGKPGEAIAALKNAVAEEDNLVYREPQDWLIPARQYLGNYLLKVNKAKEAERVYGKDLIANPGNGWSLLGMYQCLLAQKKVKEAAKYKSAYIKAFEAADVEPAGSVF